MYLGDNLAPVTPISTAGSKGLDTQTQAIFHKLLNNLLAKQSRNRTRQQYYDQKVTLKDFGISLPPQLRSIESVLGWPAKTVDVLADRIQFERFVAPGQDEDPFGLNQIVIENDFRNGFSQAVTSALTHSCSFITVTHGEVNAGEPEILWIPKSAQSATGIWDNRRRALSAGLSVLSNSAEGLPEDLVLYLPEETIYIRIGQGGKLFYESVPNLTGRVLMEPVIADADLKRPFGRSRISRAVMSLTDSAIRTIVRSEIGAEFFSAPQRWVTGADPDIFESQMERWSAVVSRVLTIDRDEEGNLPNMGQFSQMSMQPHTDQLRQWAALLAAESQIPLDELGFPSDNPSSDSAIQSQRDPLRLAADRMIRGFQSSVHRLAVTSVMLRDGGQEPVGLKQVAGWFAPTLHVSDAAAADAVLKQVNVMPWLAESPVILEKLGYSQAAIERLLADKRRAQGTKNLLTLAQAASDLANPPAPADEDDVFTS